MFRDDLCVSLFYVSEPLSLHVYGKFPWLLMGQFILIFQNHCMKTNRPFLPIHVVKEGPNYATLDIALSA